MSVPTEFDYALIKMGDGATPTEVFTAICGIEQVGRNFVVQTSERTRRNCTTPGLPGVRRIRAVGESCTVTGSGAIDKAEVAKFRAAMGKVKNYRVEYYQENGTGDGVLWGTDAGPFMLTAHNMTGQMGGDSASEITLESDGDVTWTAA